MGCQTIIVYHQKSSERATLQNSTTLSTVSPANFERRLRTGLEGIRHRSPTRRLNIRNIAKVNTR